MGRFVVMAVLSAILLSSLVGCAGTVKRALRESSLDASEEARGDPAWNGGHYYRETDLAVKYIQSLPADVDSLGLYSVVFRNLSGVRKVSFHLYKQDRWTGELVEFFGTGAMKKGQTIKKRFPPGNYMCQALFMQRQVSPNFCFELGKVSEFDPQTNEYCGELIEYQF